jgi:hypothetical protein
VRPLALLVNLSRRKHSFNISSNSLLQMTKYSHYFRLFILANSIVAQAIHVVECPEFRSLLLLLREDLQEKDIPHRTKIRESIIKAWQAWFTSLKKDLAVRPIVF